MKIKNICSILLLSIAFALYANSASFSNQDTNNEKPYSSNIKFVLIDDNTTLMNLKSDNQIPTFDGRYIKSVSASIDKNNNASVAIVFTKTGMLKLNKITEINKGKKLGIIANEALLSSIPIKEQIKDGKAVINNLSIQDALNLALTINKTK